MLRRFWTPAYKETELEWNAWRPRELNQSNAPSRLETTNLEDAGCIRDDTQCDELWLLLIEKRGGEPPAAFSPT